MNGRTPGSRLWPAVARLGPVGTFFALLAAVEMLLLAPLEDLRVPRVWLAVLSTHAVVAGGVVLGAFGASVMVRVSTGALGRVGKARSKRSRHGDPSIGDAAIGKAGDFGLRDWTVGSWGLALAALVAGFAHGWAVFKVPLGEAVGRPAALGIVAIAIFAGFWLLRRGAAPGNWHLVVPIVFALAGMLGYYLLRSSPLGLSGRSRAASVAVIAVFAVLGAAVLRSRRRRRTTVLTGLLLSMVLAVRWIAPAPHAPIAEASRPGEGSLSPTAAHPVLLIVVDTLRADALDLDGGPHGRTPHLARMAAASDVFTRAVANGSWTLPSHASLFTGLRVSRHRVDMTSARGFGARLDRSVPTLHERFGARGYATACIAANGIVGPASGLTRGCARYRHPGRAWTLQTAPLRLWYALTPSARPALEEQLLTLATGLRRHATAAEVLALALAELDAMTEPPYLFLNLMDVHKPYPPAPEISAADNLSFLFDLVGTLSGVGDPEAFDRSGAGWARRSYLEQVARLDEALGRFFTELRERGLYDEALIVVTADHGEAFFDNQDLPLYYDHHGAYEAAVRVPLIVKRPAERAGGQGRRFAHLVELADVAPAILALARGGAAEGRLYAGDVSAAALTEWNPHPIPGAMSTLPVQRIGLYRDGYKLVLEGDWGDAPAIRLFDLERGPFEDVELSASAPDTSERLHSELLETLGREWNAGSARQGEAEPDPELLEILRSLGYIE